MAGPAHTDYLFKLMIILFYFIIGIKVADTAYLRHQLHVLLNRN